MKTDNEFEIFQPQNLSELDSLLTTSDKNYQFIAGGTDLLVQNKKWESYSKIIDLKSVEEISNKIFLEGSYLYIGATNSYSDIINNNLVNEYFPIISAACKQIGSVQIQNRGTIGGNICNASPAGDTLPVLSVLDAELLIGPKENGNFKVISFNSFYTGFKTFCLNKNEYIAYIRIKTPDERPTYWYFRKVGQRYSMAISKVSLALIINLKNNFIVDIKISTGSVKPYIKTEKEIEDILINKELNDIVINLAVEKLKNNISPITDIRSNQKFRKYIVGQLLKEALIKAKDVL